MLNYKKIAHYVPSIPSRAYSPHPTRGAIDQPRDQIQVNVMHAVALEKVKGFPDNPFTITL